MNRKAYAVKYGTNQYQVYTWSKRHNCYWQSHATDWWRARAQLGEANCRNPATCIKPSHHHTSEES